MTRGSVAVLSPHRARGRLIARDLRAAGDFEVEALEPEEALEGTEADILVVDAACGGRGAAAAAVSTLVPELRARTATRHCGVLALLPGDDVATSVLALDLGADDVLAEGAAPAEAALRIDAQLARKRQRDLLRQHVREGLQMAVTDPLTGVFNRRYAMSHLDRQCERAAKRGSPLAVLVLDLDRFKAINDRHGHAAGDAVLTEVAGRIRDNLRSVDMFGRIGGEEFLVVMPDTPLALARAAAERLCRLVAARPVLADGAPVPVTISIGVAYVDGPGVAAQAGVPGTAMARRLMVAADRALYGAKGEGRDRVTVDQNAA
ncbi:MAG: diguanylate cyclase [Hasllibacter sp.]